MISLTDIAIFDKISEVTGIQRGVFVPDSEAFRIIKKKFGALELPVFSLFRTNVAREDNRRGRTTATKGQPGAVARNSLTRKKIFTIPAVASYELTMWTRDHIDLIDILRKWSFFSDEPGGNGVTLDIPELELENIGIPFDMEIDYTIQRSEPTDEGRHYSTVATFRAHTFFAKGLDEHVVRRIVLKFYTSTTEMTVEESVLQRTLTQELPVGTGT